MFKKKISKISIIISLSIICICFLNPNLESIHALSNRLIIISDKITNTNIDYAKEFDARYVNINTHIYTAKEISNITIDSRDILVVDNELLNNNSIKKLVEEKLVNDYVYFIGNSDIDSLSNKLGKKLTEYQPIYSFNNEIISKEIKEMGNNRYSILQYTNNSYLKGNIKNILLGENASYSEYLIPCFDLYLEMKAPSLFSYQMNQSGTSYRTYFINQTTSKIQSNYIESRHRLYKNINDGDSSKDYYLLKTGTWFSSKGHYLILQHIGPSNNNALELHKRPLNSGGTTSYSFGYKNLSVSYSGPKAKIILKNLNSYTNQWTFMDGTLLQNANFDSGDVFEAMTEYSVNQGSKPKFSYRIYALDKGVGRVNYETINIYAN